LLSSEQWGDVLKNMKEIILFSISGWSNVVGQYHSLGWRKSNDKIP